MAMRIQPDTLRDEVDQVMAILKRWQDRLSEGVPGEEQPAGNPEALDVFQFQLRGELHLCAERLTAVVEVLE